MPYTQANPLDQTVQDAFDLKVKMLEARGSGKEGSEEATYYFNARTPWIKMTSCVDVVSSTIRDKFELQTATSLAEKYVLGLTKPGDAFSGHNVDKARTLGEPGTNSYGIRPQPGIQNMDIVSYNKYGSLRKGTINFQVWTKEDLDACEMLYMRPGMSILLEWGWSLYPETGENGEYLIKDMGPGLSKEVLAGKYKSLHQVLGAIVKKQKAYNYGYDAIFGFVKNFKWTVRPDGGYDCSTELVTAGELVESINMAKPLADADVQAYDFILGTYTNELAGKAFKQGVSRAASFGDDFKVGADGKLYRELMTQIKDIPSAETQTVLSAFISYDINLFANKIFDKQLTNQEDKKPTLQFLSIQNIADEDTVKGLNPETGQKFSPPISTRLSQNATFLGADDVLRINWIDPAYSEDKKGNIEFKPETGDAKVLADRNPQTYIKYGLLLEILNNHMLQQGTNTVTPFDVAAGSNFTVLPNLTISIDPSVCLLPLEEVILRQVVPNSNNTTAPAQEDSTIASRNIYDIRINTALLEDIIQSSGLAKVSQEGIPYLRIFDMIQTLNTKINECTGNLLNLDIQYYDHLGTFSIIDRKTFSSNKKYNRLNVYGLKSLMHSIGITSALTPDMSSALAISAQTKVTNADSHSAGFLRFNDGIRDRVITDRSLDGVIVKNTNVEYSNTTKEDFSEIFTLYETIYAKLIWAEANFPYAKNKFVEFVKQLTGNTEQGVVGQVIIPFSTGLTMDGMSGFRIMNGFTLDPKILPYKYNIKGGVGQIITGLQATVDSISWKTQLKTKFYNLEAGQLSTGLFDQTGVTTESDITSNYVYKYAKELSALDYSYYSPYTTTFTSADALERLVEYFGGNIGKDPIQIIEGTYNEYRIDDMQWQIDFHYKLFWDNGNRKEVEDAAKSVGDSRITVTTLGAFSGLGVRSSGTVVPTPSTTSALQMYWINRQKNFADTDIWKNHNKYPWSAVYVSYMMGKVDLGDKIGVGGGGAKPFLQGYGSPRWYKTTSSHYGYASVARGKRLTKQTGGNWVAFALRDINAEEQLASEDELAANFVQPAIPYGVRIRAQAGDVLIKPRSGDDYNSHGAIVYSVEDGKVTIAHGNMDNTNKKEEVVGFVDQNDYYVADNPQGYLLVLKRFE